MYRHNFSNLDQSDYSKLSELHTTLKYISTNQDTNYLVQILDNLEKYLNIIFDNAIS